RNVTGEREWTSAWASVFTVMNSTPCTPASIIRLTALLPPPPTPITLMWAKFSISPNENEDPYMLRGVPDTVLPPDRLFICRCQSYHTRVSDFRLEGLRVLRSIVRTFKPSNFR